GARDWRINFYNNPIDNTPTFHTWIRGIEKSFKHGDRKGYLIVNPDLPPAGNNLQEYELTFTDPADLIQVHHNYYVLVHDAMDLLRFKYPEIGMIGRPFENNLWLQKAVAIEEGAIKLGPRTKFYNQGYSIFEGRWFDEPNTYILNALTVGDVVEDLQNYRRLYEAQGRNLALLFKNLIPDMDPDGRFTYMNEMTLNRENHVTRSILGQFVQAMQLSSGHRTFITNQWIEFVSNEAIILHSQVETPNKNYRQMVEFVERLSRIRKQRGELIIAQYNYKLEPFNVAPSNDHPGKFYQRLIDIANAGEGDGNIYYMFNLDVPAWKKIAIALTPDEQRRFLETLNYIKDNQILVETIAEMAQVPNATIDGDDLDSRILNQVIVNFAIETRPGYREIRSADGRYAIVPRFADKTQLEQELYKIYDLFNAIRGTEVEDVLTNNYG
ncbi:MAG TPA: hypothetical protein PKH98_05855, partial [Candidatus Omnitrophota bacterium]|nr:hypothetical protein [Candidatus Omnitrophota bacterium]